MHMQIARESMHLNPSGVDRIFFFNGGGGGGGR